MTSAHLAPARHPASAVTETSAESAFEAVLATAGATLPKRDGVDARIVSDVRSKIGSQINHPSEVGGWPTLISTAAPADADGDGMPDVFDPHLDVFSAWEDTNGDGWTDLEAYLSGLPIE